MFLLRVLEILSMILVVALILSQIAYPLLMNRQMFWLFRRSTPQKEIEELRGKLAVAEAKADAMALQAELDKKQNELNKDKNKEQAGVREPVYYEPEKEEKPKTN